MRASAQRPTRPAAWATMVWLLGVGLVLGLAGTALVVATGSRYVRGPDLSFGEADAAYEACRGFAQPRLADIRTVTFDPIRRRSVRRYADGRLYVRAYAEARTGDQRDGRDVSVRISCTLRRGTAGGWELEALRVWTADARAAGQPAGAGHDGQPDDDHQQLDELGDAQGRDTPDATGPFTATGRDVARRRAMTPKPSPAMDPLTPESPSLTDPMPTPAGSAAPGAPPLRCLQRPTGEWFTIAVANAPGKDTPDATDLWTESEARERLQAFGLAPDAVDARIAAARATPEVSGDELPLPDPVVGGPAPKAE